MLTGIKTILSHSLTNSDGQYSSKKIMTFIAFNYCVLIGLIDQFTKFKLNELVFTSFLLMAGGQSALSVVSNKLNVDTNKTLTALNDQLVNSDDKNLIKQSENKDN